MTGAEEALIVVCAAGVSSVSLLATRAGVWPWYRRLRRLAAQRRAVAGFPRLNSWQRARREMQLRITPRGQLYQVRVLRLRLVDGLERAGAAALILARMERVNSDLAALIKRLRVLGIGLDRRLKLMTLLRDPVLLAREISSAARSVGEVERMAESLTALAAAAASGTIDLEAASLRRELEAEVQALQAGMQRETELASDAAAGGGV
jgi:hypothetical protein